MKPSQGVIAAAVALVLGGGFMGGAALFGSKTERRRTWLSRAQTAPPPDPTTLAMLKVQDEVHTLKVSVDSMRAVNENNRQDEAIRSLKKSVDILKQDLEVAKASNAGAVAQLSTKIDKLDRDPSPKLAEISARLDRLDRGDKEPSGEARRNRRAARSAEGRFEQQQARRDHRAARPDREAGVLAGARRLHHAAAAPARCRGTCRRGRSRPAAGRAEGSGETRLPTIDGWTVRDVFYGGWRCSKGVAGLREVSTGQFLPGVGEIRSIERRGRGWVVVTSRGIIEAENGW